MSLRLLALLVGLLAIGAAHGYLFDSSALDNASYKAAEVQEHGMQQQQTQQVARVTKPAPYFKEEAVVGQAFQEISLDDYKGKYLVIIFYPLDFTFVCPTELSAYSDAAPQFKQLGAELLGASVDSKYTHLAWVNTPRNQGGLGHVNYPIISDIKRNMSRAYGVLLEEQGHALRGTFIIDRNGIVRHIGMNDPPVGRSVEETLRLVQACQHVDEFGEVCPVNWKPGQKAMKADPKEAKKFFESTYAQEGRKLEASH